MSVEEQAALHAEAYRRAHPGREIPEGSPPIGVPENGGFRIGPETVRNPKAADTWSSGGNMPGIMTPDLQGPEPPLGQTAVAPVETPRNMEDIIRNPHGSL